MSVNKNNSDIERAVRDIPGLIYDEVHKKNRTGKTPVYVSPHHSKTWLITGVIIFSLCIIGLWGINAASIVYETKNSNDDTLNIIRDSQSELQKVINTFGDNEQAPELTLDDVEKTNSSNTMTTSTATSTDNPIIMLVDKLLSQTNTTTSSTIQ